MSEQTLQTASDDQSQTESQPGAESAPASEGQHEEKVTFDEKQQEHVDALVGEKTAKFRQTERELQRELQEANRRADEAEGKLNQSTRPEIPPVPDPYDDDYEAKVAERDEAIRKAADFDAEQSSRAQREAEQLEQKQLKDAKALFESAQSYTERAVQLGMTAEELEKAGGIVRAYGISENIADFILNDEHGPLITKYLALHPDELEEISNLGSAGYAKVINDVKKKAAALSAKTSDAPPPPDEVAGGRGIPRVRPGPKGAVYE